MGPVRVENALSRSASYRVEESKTVFTFTKFTSRLKHQNTAGYFLFGSFNLHQCLGIVNSCVFVQLLVCMVCVYVFMCMHVLTYKSLSGLCLIRAEC